MQKIIHTSAPGTLMLMGEHAVLHGTHCLVAATDQRIHLYLTPRNDQTIQIESSLGQFDTPLAKLKITEPFTFVTAAIKQFQKFLTHGFHLRIESDFSTHVGLGSSAAVLAATIQALLQLLEFQLQAPEILFEFASKALLTVQGCGSGADLAASILGGMVHYRQKPFYWKKLDIRLPDITLVYSGYKTSTPEVIQIVEAARQEDPKKYDQIFRAMDQAVLGAETDFIGSFQICQSLMVELGVVDKTLQDIINLFKPIPAKVSGSGLGDSVIGLGNCTKIGDYQIIPAQLAQEGVITHAG